MFIDCDNYFSLNDFTREIVNKAKPETFTLETKYFFHEVIQSVIPLNWRAHCFIAGGHFTKYCGLKRKDFPNLYNMFYYEQDIDIFVLHEIDCDLIEKQISQSNSERGIKIQYLNGLRNIRYSHEMIKYTMKLKVDNGTIINIISVKNGWSMARVVDNFDLFFCNILYRYDNNQVFMKYDLYKYLTVEEHDRQANYQEINEFRIVKYFMKDLISIDVLKAQENRF